MANKKLRIVSLAIIMFFIFNGLILPERYITSHGSAIAGWQELFVQQMDIAKVFEVSDGYLAIQKNDKKSTIHLWNQTWQSILQSVNEIEAAYKDASGEIWMAGSKNGAAFYKFSADGQSYNNLLQEGMTIPSNIVSKNKIESILVDGNNLILAVEKHGLYFSQDFGQTWVLSNGNLPKEPGKNDYDVRQIIKAEGVYFAATKKQGILKSNDLLNWQHIFDYSQYPESVRDVFCMSYKNGVLFAGTKNGIWKYQMQEESWIKIGDINDEIRSIVVEQGTLYALAKNERNIYCYNLIDSSGKWLNKPSDANIDEPRDMIYSSDANVFAIAHKKGLVLAHNDTSQYLSASQIASSISGLGSLSSYPQNIVLPNMPDGFTVSIFSSDDETSINTLGEINYGDEEKVVHIVLKIQSIDGQDHAFTEPIAVVVPRKAQTGIFDGVYSGSSKGRNGLIKLRISIISDLINSIDIYEHNETTSMHQVRDSLSIIPQRIISEQKYDVDIVSGATITSKAIMNAVKNALAGTKFDVEMIDISQDISPDAYEGVYILSSEKNLIYISRDKENKKSNVWIKTPQNDFAPVLQNIPEIEAAAAYDKFGTVFIISSKENRKAYLSSDNGVTWNEIISVNGLPNEKVESILIANHNELYALVSKKGIYRSVDAGNNWTEYNGNIPANPEKPEEYDVRKLFAADGVWLAATKKQGVLFSYDGQNWLKLKETALPKEAKDVWDIAVISNTIYAATKKGLWKTSLLDENEWRIVDESVQSELRNILFSGNKLFVLDKNMELRYLNDEEKLVPMVKNSVIIYGEGIKNAVEADGYFYIAYKQGLAKIKNILKSFTYIESGGTNDYSQQINLENQWKKKLINELSINVRKSPYFEDGPTQQKAEIKITEEDIKEEEILQNKPYKITISHDRMIDKLKISMQTEVYKAIKENAKKTVLEYPGGFWTVNLQQDIFEEHSKQFGKLLSVNFIVEKAENKGKMPEDGILISTPMYFSVQAEYENGRVNFDDIRMQFNEYAAEIEDESKETDLSMLYGAIFENGNWNWVPSIVLEKEGKKVVVIKHNKNGMFGILKNQKTFKDISSHWSKKNVEKLAARNIIKGNNKGFGPESYLTRAEFAAMLVRALALDVSVDGHSVFNDVSSDKWYYKYVNAAFRYELAKGTKNGDFLPDAYLTRQEMTAMTVRAIKLYEESKGVLTTKSDSTPKLNDGLYSGEAEGFYGSPLKVNITVKDGKIQGANIVEMNETPGIGDIAAQNTLNKMLELQTHDVDIISGATISSKAVSKAFYRALIKSYSSSSGFAGEQADSKKDGYMQAAYAIKDKNQISSWALSYVGYAYGKGIMKGYNDGTFRATNISKRAEGANVIYDVLRYLEFIN